MYRLLALLSGAPALVYQVVWTREVALLVGSQIEATSIVLAIFFGGLALGARGFGRTSDATPAPLHLYAALEAGAGLLAVASFFCLRSVGASSWVGLPLPVLLCLTAVILVPVSLLLGGTLPALLRAAEKRADRAARSAGWLVGLNTAGAVVGVLLATAAIPELGLRATLLLAATGSVAVAAFALALAVFRVREDPQPPRPDVKPEVNFEVNFEVESDPQATREQTRSPVAALVAAAIAGLATLAFEVLSSRMAAIRLGSSLYAWALVLCCVLGGLALGNLLTAGRAARSKNPRRELGWIEALAAIAVAGGVGMLSQSPAMPSPGLTGSGLLAVALGIGPAALFMGAAFPYFVRLAIPAGEDASIGGGFGALSAANTAGGVVGSLLAPFALVPMFGLTGGALACAGINAALGIAILCSAAGDELEAADPGAGPDTRRYARLGVLGAQSVGVIALVVVASLPALAPPALPAGTRIDFVADGRQATAAVARIADRRDLIVDGDPEASTHGAARATEDFLAVLPLLLHPEPRSLLEVGLGSGITLGMASTFPLERIECVEIADSVLAAARFFEPDNRGVASGADPRIQIARGDGRAYLARHSGEYDVAIANTLHPWALGATGLYSLEYFTRLAESLRPGGIAGQWLPVERIGAQHLTAILRTFFAVFSEGALWWGEGNLILIGSREVIPELDPERFEGLPSEASKALARMGITRLSELRARRLASAAVLRDALGTGELLSDDRPVLEARGARRRSHISEPATSAETGATSELEVVQKIARAGNQVDPGARGIRLWLESLVLRNAGDQEAADEKERLAGATGLALARRAPGLRLLSQAASAVARGEFDAGRLLIEQALDVAPDEPKGLFNLAVIARELGNLATAKRHLLQLVATHPEYTRGLNLLGVVLQEGGDASGARAVFNRALVLDPNFREPLVNAGLLAVVAGDRTQALRLLARLEELDSGITSLEAQALAAALAGH